MEPLPTLRREVQSKIIVGCLNLAFSKATPRIKEGFKNLVVEAIKATDEYFSLLNFIGSSAPGSPTLKEHFGLPDAQRRIDEVIGAWASGIEVDRRDFILRGTRIAGGLRFGIVRKDLGEVQGLSAASFVTPENGYTLDWLRWLMERGDDMIVKEYEINPGRGRAGDFIMKPVTGGLWGVPKEYRGTPGFNFTTRAVEKLNRKVLNLVKSEILRSF